MDVKRTLPYNTRKSDAASYPHCPEGENKVAIYHKIGKIRPINSLDATDTRFGIGMEKLDRAVFDPVKVYDAVAKLGVKRVRLQSGWMRTEKKKGIYDFLWLDEVVDNLIERGIRPWICLCYGNPLYTESARDIFGAVGYPPVSTKEERSAWANYCESVARHFKGRVSEYEVWNEPDSEWCWKSGVKGAEYGKFVIETAKAVKKGDKNAVILAGSICNREFIEWTEAAFSVGMGDYTDVFTYHDYCEHERRTSETVSVLRSLTSKYNEKIKLANGETGCPSSGDGFGAMAHGNWSEDKQARLLTRRIIAELYNEVTFVSWFTAVDMIEALNGKNSDKSSYLDYGYFGVLRAEFDRNGFSSGEYSPKLSFYALANVVSLFQNAKKSDFPLMIRSKTYSDKIYDFTDEYADLTTAMFEKSGGGRAFAYYKSTNVLTTTYEGVFEIKTAFPFKSVRLADVLTGDVFEIPQENITDKGYGVYAFRDLPVKDYPMAILFDDFEKNN